MGGLGLLMVAGGLSLSGLNGLPLLICAFIILFGSFGLFYATSNRKWIPILAAVATAGIIGSAYVQIGSRDLLFVAAGILIILMAASVFLPPPRTSA